MSWNWLVSSRRQASSSSAATSPGGAGGRRPQLGRRERRLVPPVAPLDPGLAGVRAPVLLEVELADPHRQAAPGRPRTAAKNDAGRLEGHHREAVSRRRGRTAAGRTRASPGSGRRRRRRGRRGRASGSTRALRRTASPQLDHVAVVGVGGREVGEDAGAVDPLPPERVVREGVGLVPRHLLRTRTSRCRPRPGSAGSAAE